ncbi:MAG: hypothetical protein ABIJ47_07265 [Candidatus Bathyarchaeota archaeon]
MPLKIYSHEKNIGIVLKDYQEAALRYLWQLGDKGAGSCEVWMHVNEDLKEKTISRGAIILFLNTMVYEGVLDYTDALGKGGHRRIYTSMCNEAGFKKNYVKMVLKSLIRDYPEETHKIYKTLLDVI